MRPRLRRILACASCSTLAATLVWFVPVGAANKAARPKPVTREVRGRRVPGESGGGATPGALGEQDGRPSSPQVQHEPRQQQMHRAGSFDGDVRAIGETHATRKRERPEREGPAIIPAPFPGAPRSTAPTQPLGGAQSLSAPAPSPSSSFEGLDFATWGAGHPPDTNGDVGPTYYIQTVNTSVGIYSKSDGSRVAAFTFDTFMSQGHFGNLCDTDNYGDPVVLYDSFEDRWVITDFAFQLDGNGAVVNPPGAFQCFAVSKSGDPVTGGWNYYWINTITGLGDYPKFGIWPDGIYMSVNLFGYPAGSLFQSPRLYALNKALMYAGAQTVPVISFDAPSSEFTILPANARLQTGTPPAGSPNYFASVGIFDNAIELWKFHVDWNGVSTATLTGPFTALTTTLSTLTSSTAPTPANAIDTLSYRTMMQNQYSNIGGVESLWDSHTVGASGTSSSQAAVRYYQVKVTGGAVEANATQSFTYSPDATIHRFLPSVAVDRAGNMAIGYSASSSTVNPSIRYAGRLAGDPVNSITQTETILLAGAGSQSGACGGAACDRWGDYSAMTLDPDGCTFWYTNEYYQVTGLNDRTRIFSFSLPSCSRIGTGTLSGTVRTAGGVVIAGATVALGNRTATTDAGGVYLFASIPAGTYPGLSASAAGYTPATVSSIAVPDGGSVTRDFALSTAPQSNCLIDTTQANFEIGTATNCDLTSSPGDVTLLNPSRVDQENTSVTVNGFGVTATSWAGQTFTPAVSGKLTRVDLDLFCANCTGTTPNLTVSIRATAVSGNTRIPTGADIAQATIAGFSSGAGGFFPAIFASPPTLTAGTRYAIIVRPVANPSAGTYAYACSCAGNGYVNSNPYASGQRVTSSDSGGTWSADTTSQGRDLGFDTFIQDGFPASGTFVSSTKDANPAVGGSAVWGNLSWTASVPAGTTLGFQAAGSNDPIGGFVFVGPDGTANTFFSNGGSLARFNGYRYLKYQVLFTTSNSGATPTLNDVTICFTNAPPAAATTLAVSPSSGIYGGTTTLSASLSAGGSGVSGRTVSFTLLGNGAGSAVTNAAGVATLSGVGLSGVNAGTYIGAVAASFAGDANNQASSGTNTLTVGRAAQTITFGALAGKSLGDPDFTVAATASSGLAVSFAASGQCTIAGNLVHLTASGSCTITASQAGNTNFNAAPDVPQTFAIAATITPEVVAQALLNGANRLGPPLQHPDGGWYFLASATDCGVAPPSPSQPAPSCSNLYGINGLGLLEAYRHNPSNAALLQDARSAGDALVAIFAAQDPLARTRPVMQDVEFLGALSQTSGDATYMTTATDWFAVLVAQYPSAATRVDEIFTTRDKQGFRSFGAWDAASLVRAARAVGNVTYATDAANRIVDRELDRVENNVLLEGWKYLTPASAPSDNPYGYDYTLMGEGSLLSSIFDLPGFSANRSEYLSFLLGQQDPAGTWDGGDLQMTAYIVKGLIALGDASANGAIARAENFFAAHQQANGGWPYYIIDSGSGPEYTEIDSEVMQALSALYNTPSGSQVATQPSPLAALRFSTVASVGTTTVTAVDPATTGTVPAGYVLAPFGYNAATTARLGTAATDGITVCLWAPTIADPIAFANLRVLHNENGALVDRTSRAPDFATRTICGRVNALGPLALAVFDPSPLTITSITSTVSAAPGNHGAVVTLSVATQDLFDPAPRCMVTDVAGVPHDWQMTGPLTVLFRGEAEKRHDRSYVMTVVCTDASGNPASAQATVVVADRP